ncbi:MULTISPECIES: hypothetical protein [Peribacillus]|uniref:hypothetical protein n=1 Tax=Peribacillus TaxID=2675229 RepID=UPI0024E26236|nr:hypothetical protein [Peribacillus simplex]MDF9759852.1 hypothetical protein [Peribacillus simplex]
MKMYEQIKNALTCLHPPHFVLGEQVRKSGLLELGKNVDYPPEVTHGHLQEAVHFAEAAANMDRQFSQFNNMGMDTFLRGCLFYLKINVEFLYSAR